jgi:hypothetical protein
MVKDDGLKAEATQQIRTLRRQMVERILEVADRMVGALESLHAQFPSDELREALLSTRGWRDRLRAWMEAESHR